MKFRSERDALVEMLATAGRAVGGRADLVPGALSACCLTCTGNMLYGDRDRPRPDDPGHRRGHRDRRRQLCRSGPALDRHRAPARAGRGDLRRRRRPHHDLGRPVDLQVARPIRSWSSRRSARTNEPTTHLPEAALGEAVRQVVRAASHDDGRPLLTGVLVSRVDGSMRMVATDSYRMAMRDLPGIDGIPGEEDLLVPARASAELQRLPARHDHRRGRGRAASAWRPAATRSPSGRETSRSARGCSRAAIPDYKQLIPDHYPNRLHLGQGDASSPRCAGCSSWSATTRRRCGCPCARRAST